MKFLGFEFWQILIIIWGLICIVMVYSMNRKINKLTKKNKNNENKKFD